jgi:uncharacterized protein (DUF1697 family)
VIGGAVILRNRQIAGQLTEVGAHRAIVAGHALADSYGVGMERYVAFLRGMNLGGRRIKNEELGREFERLGFTEVSCFRASGNVVFTAERGSEGDLTVRIEGGLADGLGYDVPVFLRDADELLGIAAHEPFEPSLVEGSKGKLQVALLPTKLSAKVGKEASSLSSEEDRLALEGRELYWLPSGGISESALDLKQLESILGPWTMRTKGTIKQIAAKHFAD